MRAKNQIVINGIRRGIFKLRLSLAMPSKNSVSVAKHRALVSMLAEVAPLYSLLWGSV